ncbi:hypothetical protein [Paenibacillus glycanilyticus]|uniref:hypothetical protein n=1 Tax=Paenibacillus glycanilyticus TaxID=126569 RepID=UPI0019104F9C|nr:hypothetical protein [Paenibacillus glycanilyticus]
MAKLTPEQRAANKAKGEKKRRVTLEEKRLRQTYEKLPKDKMAVADGLIRRAAFMRVTLEDYEADLFENGSVEQFTQSEKTAAYERERPVARLYNTLNKNYQSIMKQLADMLPKEDPDMLPDDKEKDDGFDEFVNRR